jgi:flagellar M-ring protein FliF
MADYQNKVPKELTSFLGRLTTGQKILMGLVVVAVVGGIIGLISFVNRPTYSTLFSNVNPQDAAKIVEKLKEKNIPFTLEDGGKTILIPKQQIYELRLALAGEGLPQSSVIGYEIFDRTNLGVSDFVQKVNYRRAIEGEIARTILQLDEVEGARVHIVVPEKALFQEDEKPATASVVLKLKTGKPLAKNIIQGITHLVSSSVEGLDPSNVTIVDTRGGLLSDNSKPNTVAALTSSQYDMQRSVEQYLAQKAQSMLEGVLGPGNAIVQVNAELDFRQVERTMEQYDPEKTAVRSEQLTEEKGAGADSGSGSSRTNSITNYEVNKNIERIVENAGGVKRITVAALINGTQKNVESNGTQSSEYVPRKKEEIDQLTDIVKRAVGFNQLRNDEVSVVNHQFDTTLKEQDMVYKETPFSDWYQIADKVFLLVAMLGGVFIIRSLLGRLRVSSAGGSLSGNPLGVAIHGGQGNRRQIHLPSPDEEISEDAMLRAERRKSIVGYVKDKPEEASRLLKVWLSEE